MLSSGVENLQLQQQTQGPLETVETRLMEVGNCAAPGIRNTCIQDLPDEVLGSIMRLLSSDFLLPIHREIHEDMSVEHTLQCALVCKRWRSVADSTICTLRLNSSDLTEPFAQHLGKRFRHLKSVAFNAVVGEEGGDPLATLALHTPQLMHLRLGSASVSLGHTLLRWTSLRGLNLGDTLWNKGSSEVEATLDALAQLPTLQHLEFGCNFVQSAGIWDRVSTMTKLTKLALACPDIPPVSLSHILFKLQVRSFAGTHLSESLGAFGKLETLMVLRAGAMILLPESLGLLSRLTYLAIVNCRRLAWLPNSFGQLSSLETFELQAAGRWSAATAHLWPQSLANLVSLQRLVVLGPYFAPQSLGQLTSLTSIEMGGHWMLPEDLGNLPSLRELHLTAIHSIGMPPPGCISSLQVLWLQACNLHANAAALRLPTELKELEISDSDHLEALPRSVRPFLGLRTCKLSQLSSLRRLPDRIGEWRMLSRLEVSGCPLLKALPEGLGQLSALKELLLEELCSLVSLPQSLGGLSCLRLLRVTSCKCLTMLPDTIVDLGALRLLLVKECDALGPETQRLFRRLGRKSDLQVILS